MALAALAVLVAGVALADRYDEQIPEKPQRYVTDRAGVFGPGEAEALNARLEQFERDTSNQILVWVDQKLPEGFTLEDFTVRAGAEVGRGAEAGGQRRDPLRLHRRPEGPDRDRVRPRGRPARRDGQADHRRRDRPALSRGRLSRRDRCRRERDDGRGQGRVPRDRPDRGRGAAADPDPGLRVPRHGDHHLLPLRPADDPAEQAGIPHARRPRLVVGGRRLGRRGLVGRRLRRRRRLVRGGGGGGFSGGGGSFGGGGASGSW